VSACLTVVKIGCCCVIGQHLVSSKKQQQPIYLRMTSLVENLLKEKNFITAPDSSGNPFSFFFKKKKIGTDSGVRC